MLASLLEPNWNFLEVTLDSCLDSAENGAPHENSINSNEVEVRALGKASKTPPANVENTVRKRRRKVKCIFYAFWGHFGIHNASKNDPTTCQQTCRKRDAGLAAGWEALGLG